MTRNALIQVVIDIALRELRISQYLAGEVALCKLRQMHFSVKLRNCSLRKLHFRNSIKFVLQKFAPLNFAIRIQRCRYTLPVLQILHSPKK